jgi:hypothetical protein
MIDLANCISRHCERSPPLRGEGSGVGGTLTTDALHLHATSHDPKRLDARSHPQTLTPPLTPPHRGEGNRSALAEMVVP